MATRNKPYDQFGPYILFKKLEADALGELWRAGRIEGGQLGSTVALRRMSGGVREAVSANAHAVSQILPRISGTSFVRDQQAGIIDGVPFLSWDYAGGRSLRHIIDRARGSKDVQPNPLPLDQAIVIAEKIALSLATMADLRDTSGGRLFHGALVPQFIWISDDGEIRVAGQQLGGGLIASLQDPKVAADIGRYFSPEYRSTGQVQKHTDVYSMGAVLFLLVTGQEPPDAATASAFVSAVRAAKTTTGVPVPDDIRVLLDKSFNLDPSMRYASIGDMKQAISALANGGKYSATTFNLAFYLSHLLKKEMETETADREKEAKVAIAPYLEAPKPVAVPAPAAAPAAAPAPAMFAAAEAPKKSKLPLAIAATLVVAILGAGAYMMLGKTSAQPAAKQVATASAIPVPPAQRVVSEPIAVNATPATATDSATPATASSDPAAQQKAFEEAVRLKMQAEMMKLQDNFMSELKQKQSKNAPVVSAPTPAPAQQQAQPLIPEERATLNAAQLDQQRRADAVQEAPRTATQAPVQQVQTQTAAPAPAVAAPAAVKQVAAGVREGDVVDVGSLDSVPRPTRPIKPVYPMMAARQKISATIFLTVLVSETGAVEDVRILRGEPRFGLNDAAERAMRATRFSSPMKDGKRVKTWFPQTIDFKP
ncbi:MAG TPA: TonB family protein [Thermoanaerobaculia bacterium]|nr:TonB family protein [Thermoanaerobaculia bacterium]